MPDMVQVTFHKPKNFTHYSVGPYIAKHSTTDLTLIQTCISIPKQFCKQIFHCEQWTVTFFINKLKRIWKFSNKPPSSVISLSNMYFQFFPAPTPHNRLSLHHLNFKTISCTFITSPVARLYRFCYMLKRWVKGGEDTDHPHLVNFPWRGPPHVRVLDPPHGPRRLRCVPPWLPHGLGAHRPGHAPPLHAHDQPDQTTYRTSLDNTAHPYFIIAI